MVLLTQICLTPSHMAKTVNPEWEVGTEGTKYTSQLKEMRKISYVKPGEQNAGHNVSFFCNML